MAASSSANEQALAALRRSVASSTRFGRAPHHTGFCERAYPYKQCKGITRVLESTLYPHHKPSMLRWEARTGVSVLAGGGFGSSAGRHLHRQIETYVETGTLGVREHDDTTYAQRVLTFLDVNGVVPVCTEVPVGVAMDSCGRLLTVDEVAAETERGTNVVRLATAVDILARWKNNTRWLVIEVKSGYTEDALRWRTGELRGPLAAFPSTLRQHHHLQAAWTADALVRSVGAVAECDACVLRVRRDSVSVETVPAAMRAACADPALNAFLAAPIVRALHNRRALRATVEAAAKNGRRRPRPRPKSR